MKTTNDGCVPNSQRLFISLNSSSIGDGGSDAQFTRTPSQPSL